MAQDELKYENPEETKDLTEWSNEPTVADLRSDLESAKSAHSGQMTKVTHWLNQLNVTGDAKPKKQEGRSAVQPRLIRKQAEWRYPGLTEPFLSTEELFKAEPRSWEDKKAAIQNQTLLNYQFNIKINKVRFIDNYVRAAVNEGTVICRVGWITKSHIEVTRVPVYSYYAVQVPEQAQALQQAIQMKTEDYNNYLNLPEDIQASVEYSIENEGFFIARQTDVEEVELEVIDVNQPTVEVVNSQNVIIDPNCDGDLDKAQFVIYSFETNKSELEKDGRYMNLDRITIDSANPLNVPDHIATDKSGFQFKDDPRKVLVAYEYWGYWDIDGSGTTKPIVATFVGNTMIRLEENPYPDKKVPFVVVPYLPVPGSIYGEPDGALLEENQRIIGATTRAMVDILARSANGQTGIKKGMLDVTNKRKFDKGEDYEFNDVDPRLGIFMHTMPEIPQSAALMIQYQNNDAEALTGVKSFSQGIGSQALGDVAAGIRGALDAASKRELGIMRRLAQGVIEIGRKFTSMNSEFLSEEEVVRITNEEFVTVRRDDLIGDFDIKLSISTAEADNQKAQELSFMLQTMGNTLPFDLSQMVLADIARLRNMPDLAKRIEGYQPQPDPMAQMKAQLEIELLQAQIEETRSKAIENQANAGYKQTHAANVQADTDLKNLDYVEQESGVKQARDVEKIESQSRAQARTKIIEALLNTASTRRTQ